MGVSIVITSGKGGVGKTTLAANIGVVLASLGKRTGIVDMDIGLRNLDVVLGLEERVTYNVIDVATKKCRLMQALIKDARFPSFYVLPAAQSAYKDDLKTEDAVAVISEMKELFDYTLIDCPAGIEAGFRNSVAAADRAILVTTPQISAVRDADKVLSLIGREKEPMIIVNRVKPEMMRRGEIMSVDDILDILSAPLLGVVPDEADVLICANSGEAVSVNTDSRSGMAIRNISRRITGEQVPFLNLYEKKSFFVRLGEMLKT